MMAGSTCSNQRPDTLMQDRIARIDETSCTARPDRTLGSFTNEAGIFPFHRRVEEEVLKALSNYGGRAPNRRNSDPILFRDVS